MISRTSTAVQTVRSTRQKETLNVAGNEDIGWDGQPDVPETGLIVDSQNITEAMVISAIRSKHKLDVDEFVLTWATYELRPESGRPSYIRGEAGYQIQNGKERTIGFSIRVTYT